MANRCKQRIICNRIESHQEASIGNCLGRAIESSISKHGVARRIDIGGPEGNSKGVAVKELREERSILDQTDLLYQVDC
jgi:hypothetical protein